MPRTHVIKAALILADRGQLVTGPLQPIIKEALRKHDGASGLAPQMWPGRGVIAGDTTLVSVRCVDDANHDPKLVIEVDALDPEDAPSLHLMMRVLGDVVREGIRYYSAPCVEWLKDDRVLETERFLGMYAGLLDDPENPPALCQLPDHAQAATDINETPAPAASSDTLLRLANWAMTGVLAVLALPVAAFVGILSFVRGPSPRLMAHGLLLTAFVLFLHSKGVVATLLPPGLL